MFYRGVFVPPGLEHLLDTLKEKVQHLQHCNSSSCDSTKHQSSNDKLVNTAKLEYKKKKKQRQKKIKRQKMKEQRNSGQEGTKDKDITVIAETDSNDKVPDQEIEYVQEIPSVGDLEPTYKQFVKVFETFKLVNPKKHNQEVGEAISLIDEYDDDLPLHLQHHQTTDENGLPKLSKKKLKKLSRLTVAELKQLVGRSDVVEIHDITARDPKLLVQLKAHRNTVPVPRHWCFKKKYLQGKRGIEKPPYDLPAFIKQTGITEMRACLEEEEEDKSLKTKMRERTRPKLGKIDIDYQVLHDAFFKWQTKPRLTVHGEIYYEGKKYETQFKEKRPGALTDELRIALGMPIGLNCHKVPPPWLTAMQRYGPPPSYPNLKIPGLNTPIPEGCTFGYHAGGWGKPPVDDTGQPLYGDVFGTSRDLEVDALDKEVDRRRWGEPESESSEEEENDKDKEEDNTGKEDGTGLVTPDAEGSSSPSGITSIPPGIETPENVEFRKRKIEREMESTDNPALYTVLPERKSEGFGSSMMGSTHVYDMTGSGGLIPPSVIAARRGAVSTAEVRATEKEGAVEIALDPSELNLDSETIANRYEEAIRNRQALHRENLSDMVENHVQKQKSKRKRQLDKDTKRTKIYKEFKF